MKALQKHFVEVLNLKLQEASLSDHWYASTEVRRAVFGIRYHRDKNIAPFNYQCGVEKLFERGYFGWRRPNKLDLAKVQTPVDITNVSTRMSSNDGYEKNNDWVGWKHLNTQLKSFTDATIIAIHADNHNIDEQHPIAKQLAEEIWKLFIDYHAEIEELESFKSVGRIPCPT